MARKILLADDSVTAQNMGRKILTDAGYEVMTVNNGSAALKRVTEQRPDLIVLDVYMPGYSGLEVCQRLKDSRDTSRIPILLTVGKLEPFKPEDARRVNADAFIVKPFEASELLSALTRLEDRIVPNADAPRFSNTVSGIERFVTDSGGRRRESSDGDSGWKSRIRFPSKKKTEEPEPADEDYATTPAFRNFRRGPAKPPVVTAPAAQKPAEEPAPVRQEPGLVPDLPRDITPDELDALSALVAKLDGPAPQAEEIAPIGDKLGPGQAPPQAAAEVCAAKLESQTEGADQTGSEDVMSAPPASSVSAPEAELAAESEQVSKSNEPTPAIPVAEVPSQAGEAATAAAATETSAEISEKTPAPVDQDDEPFFATAASAVPQVDVEEEVTGAEQSVAAEPGRTEGELSEHVPAPAESMPEAKEEKPEPAAESNVSQGDRSKVEEMLAEAVAEEAASEEVAGQLAAAEDHAPSEQELAEALRLLTPTQVAASQTGFGGSQGVTQLEAGSYASNVSRWRAEAVELSAEETSLSLETEMFRSLAPPPLQPPVPAVMVSSESSETRTEIAAMSLPDAAPETAATPAPEAIAQPAPAASTEEQSTLEAKVQPQATPAATFASYLQDGLTATSSIEAATGPVAAEAEATSSGVYNQDEDTGGLQAMGKDGKGEHSKSSRSGWHQIHTAAPAAKTDVVESAKHSDATPDTEEPPKVMAAAAASDDSASGAADPNAIANIVDSVLADLRPKIVEEIAKKLAKQ